MARLQRLTHGVLINPDYARLWSGQAVSSLGDMVFSTTLMLWVGTVLAAGKPWAPAATSGVIVAIGAAMLLVGPLAGVLVDRWDARRTALVSEVVRGAVVGLLTAMSFVPVEALPIGVWIVACYLVVFVLNVASQFFQPARFTLIRDIVTGEVDRARAAGIAQATGETVMIIGPPLAAPLLFVLGVQWALLFNALSYLVSWIAIRSVAAPDRGPAPLVPPVRKDIRTEFVAGLRVFRGSRTLMVLLSIAVVSQVGIAPLSTLNVFFVAVNLHASGELYGYLGTALGVGGLVGALCTGPAVRRFGAWRVTWVGMVVVGLLLIVYSRQTSFVAGLVVLFLLAIPMTLINTAVAPLLLGAAPREYVGRTTAVFTPANQLSGMVATLAAGWLLSSVLQGFDGSVAGVGVGPIDLIFLCSGVLIVASGFYARSALRHATVAADEPVPDSPAADSPVADPTTTMP